MTGHFFFLCWKVHPTSISNFYLVWVVGTVPINSFKWNYVSLQQLSRKCMQAYFQLALICWMVKMYKKGVRKKKRQFRGINSEGDKRSEKLEKHERKKQKNPPCQNKKEETCMKGKQLQLLEKFKRKMRESRKSKLICNFY